MSRLRQMRIDQRTELQTRVDEILDGAADDDGRDLTDIEEAELASLRSDIDQLDERIDQLDRDLERRERAAGRPTVGLPVSAAVVHDPDSRLVQVRSEPTTYGEPGVGLRQALVDLAVSRGLHQSPRPENSAAAALERMQRHRSECMHPDADVRTRSIAMSDLPGVVNPAYDPSRISRGIYDRAVTVGLMQRYPVWGAGDQIIQPRVIVEASAAEQTEGAAHPSAYADVAVTQQVTADLRTVSAQAPITIQAVERGTLSVELLEDELDRAWMQALNQRILTGDNGLLNASATGHAGQWIERDDAAPSAVKLLRYLTQQKAAIWGADRRRPDAHIVDDSLVEELEDARDGNGYLLPPYSAWARNVGGAGGLPSEEGLTSELDWRRVPVYVDPAIGSTWKDDSSGGGVGGDQTRIISMCRSEMPVYYDGPMTMQYDQTLAATGQLLLVIRGYYACNPLWRPEAWRVTRGTGLKLPLPAASSDLLADGDVAALRAHIARLEEQLAALQPPPPPPEPQPEPKAKPKPKPKS